MKRCVAAALILLAFVSCRPNREVRTIQIAISHSKFSPPTISVAPGETVRFVIRNTDPIDHEFILGDVSVQERHEKGTEPSHGQKPGEVTIYSGKVATTTFEFGEAGSLIFGCHARGHYDYGMRGIVRIG